MNKARKYLQRKLNKEIRLINKNIAEDPLWKGRFIFRQTDAKFIRYGDGSGGILTVTIRGVDKKTGYYKDRILHCITPYPAELFYFINTFIAEDSGVWSEEPRITQENSADYTKIKVDEEVWRKPKNWYLSWEGMNGSEIVSKS